MQRIANAYADGMTQDYKLGRSLQSGYVNRLLGYRRTDDLYKKYLK